MHNSCWRSRLKTNVLAILTLEIMTLEIILKNGFNVTFNSSVLSVGVDSTPERMLSETYRSYKSIS